MTSGDPALALAAPNPWLAMWIRPRRTIRWILDTQPRRNVLLLASLGGVANALDRAAAKSAGDKLPIGVVLAVAIIGGIVTGPITLYVGGLLLSWTGRWLGGLGAAFQVRAALAWGQVIAVWSSLLWIPKLIVFQGELFTTETPRIDSNPILLLPLFGFIAVDVVLGIWSIVVIVRAVAEAHRFSAWRSFGAFLLAGLLVLVPLLALIFALVASTA